MASATGVDHAPYEGYEDTDEVLAGDLDATFRPVEDDRVLLWDALKTLTTPTGNLFWAPTSTLSLPDLLNSSASRVEIDALQGRCEALFADDPRMDVLCAIDFRDTVLTAQIVVRADGSGRTYSAAIDADGSLEIN